MAGNSNNENWKIGIPSKIDMSQILGELLKICKKELSKDQFLNNNSWKLSIF